MLQKMRTTVTLCGHDISHDLPGTKNELSLPGHEGSLLAWQLESKQIFCMA